MKHFYLILANSLLASVTNAFVWFAVTFWVYLETKSVIATSVMAGVYTLAVALSGFFLGSLVDRFPKKRVMLLSSVGSLALYGLAATLFVVTPLDVFANPASVRLWLFVVLALVGAIGGNLRGITLKTLVTVLVPEERRDKANGMVGTTDGVAFLVASLFSGLVIGFLGVFWMLVIAIGLTGLVVLHLLTLSIEDKTADTKDGQADTQQRNTSLDIRGMVQLIRRVPGLFGLIFFQAFNNFLAGVYMSLTDAYGLSLVSVQVWGGLWGFLSLGFIIGGVVVARKGLGQNPLRTLFRANIVMWLICSVFTLYASIVPLAVGFFIYLCLVPVVEASEQTILQKLVPAERQGRIFGFAQSVEQAASPISAFLVGPLAQLVFIPFMTTGAGVELLGPWFGTGTDRGLALLFTLAGVIGLAVTLLAMRSKSYHRLSVTYQAPDSANSSRHSHHGPTAAPRRSGGD